MKLIRTSFQFSKREWKIFIFFVLLGTMIGFLMFQNIDSSVFISEIENIEVGLANSHIHFLFLHLVVLSVLIASSFIAVGFILFPLYFLWEIICISYSIFTFAHVFGFTGFLYGIIYNIILKAVFLICLFLIFRSLFVIMKKRFFKKKEEEQTSSLQGREKVIFISVAVLLLYDLFLYFLGNQILLKLCFLLS